MADADQTFPPRSSIANARWHGTGAPPPGKHDGVEGQSSTAGRGKNRKSAFTPLFTETWRQTLIQLDQHEKLIKQTLELAR